MGRIKHGKYYTFKDKAAYVDFLNVATDEGWLLESGNEPNSDLGEKYWDNPVGLEYVRTGDKKKIITYGVFARNDGIEWKVGMGNKIIKMNTAYACPTMDNYLSFLETAEAEGLKWMKGSSPIEGDKEDGESLWEVYKEDTAVYTHAYGIYVGALEDNFRNYPLIIWKKERETSMEETNYTNGSVEAVTSKVDINEPIYLVCDCLGQYLEVMKLAKRYDWVWNNGAEPEEYNGFALYETNTVVRIHKGKMSVGPRPFVFNRSDADEQNNCGITIVNEWIEGRKNGKFFF